MREELISDIAASLRILAKNDLERLKLLRESNRLQEEAVDSAKSHNKEIVHIAGRGQRILDAPDGEVLATIAKEWPYFAKLLLVAENARVFSADVNNLTSIVRLQDAVKDLYGNADPEDILPSRY